MAESIEIGKDMHMVNRENMWKWNSREDKWKNYLRKHLNSF